MCIKRIDHRKMIRTMETIMKKAEQFEEDLADNRLSFVTYPDLQSCSGNLLGLSLVCVCVVLNLFSICLVGYDILVSLSCLLYMNQMEGNESCCEIYSRSSIVYLLKFKMRLSIQGINMLLLVLIFK